MKKKLGNNRCKFSKIMKKVSRRKKEKFRYDVSVRKTNGGVRYIKKILERIVSRINLQDLENPARKNRLQDLEKTAFSKKPCQKHKCKILIVNDEIVNDILNN